MNKLVGIWIIIGLGLQASAQVKKVNNRQLTCKQISQAVKRNRKARVGRILVHSSASACNMRSSARPVSVKDKTGRMCTAGWKCRRKTAGKTKPTTKTNSTASTKKPFPKRKKREPNRIRVSTKGRGGTRLIDHNGNNITNQAMGQISRYVEDRYSQGFRCLVYVQVKGSWAKCLNRSKINKLRKLLSDIQRSEANERARQKEYQRESRREDNRPQSERRREDRGSASESAARYESSSEYESSRETNAPIEAANETENNSERGTSAEDSAEAFSRGNTSEAIRQAENGGNENMTEGLKSGDNDKAVEGAREDGHEDAAEAISRTESGC